MMPLYGFLQGDTIGLLILAQEDRPIAELAHQLQQSARVRVRPKVAFEVWHGGHRVDPRLTVEQAGIKALDRIDVRTSGDESE